MDHWQENRHRSIDFISRYHLQGDSCRAHSAVICVGMMALSSLDGVFAWGIGLATPWYPTTHSQCPHSPPACTASTDHSASVGAHPTEQAHGRRSYSFIPPLPSALCFKPLLVSKVRSRGPNLLCEPISPSVGWGCPAGSRAGALNCCGNKEQDTPNCH